MTTKYFATLTNQGAALLANATALGTKLNITQMAVGDGNGTLPVPDPAQTKLINPKRIAPINSLNVDANDAGQIIAEQIIPENEGGFFIREIGLFNDDGILIAVANCPETYKPLLAEGSGRTQTIRMILVVSSTSAITLKIDPSVVLATRKYVDDKVIEVKGYTDDLMKKHLAAANPHNQYPLIDNALKEMADAGLVSKVLENLGLGDGSALPVGVPVPWPLATPPTGWLKYNGAAFDKLKFPKLAAVYPGGVLPDLRGYFVRGWDDGRGIDTSRALLSLQASMSHDHYHVLPTTQGTGGDGLMSAIFRDYTDALSYYPDGTNDYNPTPSTGTVLRTYTAKASFGAILGNESRPGNIAFNYIVRAA
ncbi:phage tail protein [Citrobacter koseri]|uniref:phage tail protein n=1 Tax=Citrobacter koseri TaxID=545 RepID=UPI0028BE0335|nr:phage tail protein [Citrobacter koseri]MDT7484484.1 phage tail protein [Citrobacter koseri]